MAFKTGQIYPQVGTRLPVSHKVILLIRKRLDEDLWEKNNLNSKLDGYDIYYSITTRRNQTDLKVIGPKTDKRNKFIVWTIYFPYHPIVDNEVPIKIFIRCFFEAIITSLCTFGCSEEDVMRIEAGVLKEVVGNKDFAFSETTY